MNINGNLIENQQTVADSFNGYFSTTVEKLMRANQIDIMSQLKNGVPLHYIHQNCSYPYPNIKFRYTSTKETDKIIKSFKTKNAHGYDEIHLKFLNVVSFY